MALLCNNCNKEMEVCDSCGQKFSIINSEVGGLQAYCRGILNGSHLCSELCIGRRHAALYWLSNLRVE